MQNTAFTLYQKAVRWLAAFGMCATAGLGSAQAGNVDISVGIQVPGMPVYVAPPPPPRMGYYAVPGYYAPPPVAIYPPPPPPPHYWAPAHGKRWKHQPPPRYPQPYGHRAERRGHHR